MCQNTVFFKESSQNANKCSEMAPKNNTEAKIQTEDGLEVEINPQMRQNIIFFEQNVLHIFQIFPEPDSPGSRLFSALLALAAST